MGHGSWVTWVTGQFTDGSDGSWVTKCGSLSALTDLRNTAMRPNNNNN